MSSLSEADCEALIVATGFFGEQEDRKLFLSFDLCRSLKSFDISSKKGSAARCCGCRPNRCAGRLSALARDLFEPVFGLSEGPRPAFESRASNASGTRTVP